MAYSTEHRAFDLRTPLGADALLLQEFEGSEHLSALFEFRLTLLSDRDDIAPSEIVGRRVQLRVETDHGERHFNGIVSRFGMVGARKLGGASGTEATQYQATVVPWLWQLLLHEDSRIFQNLSVPEIVEAVLADFGYRDYEFHLDGDYPPIDYCTQYRETSYHFIARLLERAGIHFWFRHGDEAETLVLVDNADHNPPLDPPQLRFRTASGGEDEGEDVVGSLRRFETLRSGRVTLRDYHFPTPTELLEASVPSILEMGQNQAFERYLHPPVHYTEQDGGDRLARLLMEAEEIEHDTLEGMGGARLMSPGYVFDLVDHPDESLDTRYLLVGVHHYGSNNLVGGQAHYLNNFTVVPHVSTWRPSLRTRKPVIAGPQTAVVVGPEGEEIHTDEYGRVKVQFHWDRRGKRDENSSCWLRVAQSWAGRGWGAISIPRIGMEVVVAFLEGDPDAPLVVGCVYNGVNTPPYALPAEQTKSALKSYSSKGGKGFNEIRFEDRAGKEQLFMHAQTDMDVRVGNDRREWVERDRSLVVKRDRLEEVHRHRHLYVKQHAVREVGGDDNLKVDGKQAVSVGGSHSLQAGGPIGMAAQSVHAKGKTDIHLDAGTNVVIEAGAMITLKCGGSFVTIGPAGVDISGPMIKLNSGGAAGSVGPASLVPPMKVVPAFVADSAKPGQEPEKSPLGKDRPGQQQDPSNHDPDPDKPHWIEVELVDEAGKPVAGESVQVTLPDGSIAGGTTDEKGLRRIDGIDPGTCRITFPDLDEKAWEEG